LPRIFNKNARNDENTKGFTLIELSIVLVIIGLIVGGVLVGQDLIKAAKIRSQINQFNEYEIAYSTFQLKYNCIAGDCINATQFFGYTTNNGDGNGLIDTDIKTSYDYSATWSGSTEIWFAFQHLGLSGMLSFISFSPSSPTIGTGIPKLKLNENSSFFFGASYNFYGGTTARNPSINNYKKGNNIIWFTYCNKLAGNNIGVFDDDCGIFNAIDLQAIDNKIDDGNPLSGKLLGFGGNNTNNDCLNIVGTIANPTTGSTYKITNTTPQCQAAFVIQ
jgi:prepilin-type N-terminal cleavage/methylation domain-containing protein